MRKRILSIILLACCSSNLLLGDEARFQLLQPMPPLLPGQSQFHFSLYGCPSDVESLKGLVEVLREEHLASAFDPGPAAVAASTEVFHYLASIGWPVVCYPPDGGRMQVKGGTSVLSDADEEAMRVLDRAGVFSAIQLGEWGYHFHRLTSDRNWWKAVLGDDYESQIDQFIKPEEWRGYDPKPATRRECYDQLRDYFQWHLQTKRGRLISVTGHSHYEAYAAEWGARVVGLELGENIGFTQSKIAFARGASRQWNIPWTVQVSPWFGNSVTTRGALNTDGDIANGLAAGHSLSLYLRMWKHAWFAGAAMVTPENSISIFFKEAQAPWELTEHGEAAASCFRFMSDHDRGRPYTPLLVILDRLAGYAPYHQLTWGILPKTAGDQETFDLLERQLYYSPTRLPVPGNPSNPEASYLHPTPFGELCDVMLSTVPGSTMKSYPVILLVGDIEFTKSVLHELSTAARGGSTIMLHTRHREAMGEQEYQALKSAGDVEELSPWTNPETGRAAAISNQRLRAIETEYLPIAVAGDPVQYQINRNRQGWVIELINNDGVVKEGRKPVVIHESVRAHVELQPRFEFVGAREWMTGEEWTNVRSIQVEIPPGESRFVEFETTANTAD